VLEPAVLLARFWPRPLLLLVLVAAFECSVGVEAASIPPHLSGDEIGPAGGLTLRLLARPSRTRFSTKLGDGCNGVNYLEKPGSGA